MQRGGDLWDFTRKIHLLRYEASGEILTPLPWSPLQTLDFAAIQSRPAGRSQLGLWIEDAVTIRTGRRAVCTREHTSCRQSARSSTTSSVFRRMRGDSRSNIGAGRRRRKALNLRG